MKYLDFSPIETQDGDAIVVELSGSAANVMVMDDSNFRNYRSRGRFKHFGGYYKSSPAVIRPPSGCWHVVVDTGGYSGKVSASVRVV